MEWYEPKEKTARIDWRCDTQHYQFQITKVSLINNFYYILYDMEGEDILKTGENIKELFFHAYILELEMERAIDEFRQRNPTS